MLDTNIVTGISAKKLLKTVDEDVDITFGNSFEECMDYLSVNNTGRDIDIARTLLKNVNQKNIKIFIIK